MNLKPVEDRIIIEPHASDYEIHGIYIPQDSEAMTSRGTVLAAGPGKLNDRGVRVLHDIQEGDTVIFKKWAGAEVNVDGTPVFILRAEEVLAVER